MHKDLNYYELASNSMSRDCEYYEQNQFKKMMKAVAEPILKKKLGV